MIRLLSLALAALIAFASTPAMAFWEYGHETVAEIALKNVKPSTRQAIARILKAGPQLDTPTCPVDTIEEASVWPDCIKTLGERFSYQYSWHYQDVDICKAFDLKAACPDGNCVSAQITRNSHLLADKSLPPRERVQALAYLVHFVGDLHQPLHAGSRDDAGGNAVKAQYGDYSAKKLNLHSIWDGYLAERAISTPPSIIRSYSDAEKAQMGAGTVENWSRESAKLSHDYAYATVMADPCGPEPKERVTLSEENIEKLVPVFQQEIVRGGLRLARLLDEALG